MMFLDWKEKITNPERKDKRFLANDLLETKKKNYQGFSKDLIKMTMRIMKSTGIIISVEPYLLMLSINYKLKLKNNEIF